MNINKIFLPVTSFISYMVMAGFLTQIGVLIQPMSVYYGIEVTEAASMFSFLTGGTLVGTIISMFIFDKLSIKATYRTIYIPLIACAFLMSQTTNVAAACTLMTIIGACCGIGLSGGAVIISRTFEGKARASVFIATDCAFSSSGYIFPTAISSLLAAGMAWYYGFYLVTIGAAIILLLTLFITFPKVTKEETQGEEAFNENIWTPRVFLFGAAVGIYLISQNTLLAWGPTYLMNEFGVTAEVANGVIGNYWGPAAIGLICAALIVTKVPPRLVLIFIALLAVADTFYLTNTNSVDNFLTAVLVLGFFTASMYKISISIGSQQVKNAPPRLVTFLLTCGTVGGTIAPALSAKFVEYAGEKSAIYLAFGGFVAVALLLFAVLTLEKKANSESETINEQSVASN